MKEQFPVSQEVQKVYSKEFLDLLVHESEKKLLEGSWVEGIDFKTWEKERSFLAEVINRDGTILDIGCANGFLLRCFQEWSKHKLDPYGVDIDEGRLIQARRLFANIPEHFINIETVDKQIVVEQGFPTQFDTVYWNVWDNFFFDEAGLERLKKYLSGVKDGGRLILFFCDRDRKVNESKIHQLKKLGYAVSAPLLANDQSNEMAVYVEKSKSSSD